MDVPTGFPTALVVPRREITPLPVSPVSGLSFVASDLSPLASPRTVPTGVVTTCTYDVLNRVTLKIKALLRPRRSPSWVIPRPPWDFSMRGHGLRLLLSHRVLRATRRATAGPEAHRSQRPESRGDTSMPLVVEMSARMSVSEDGRAVAPTGGGDVQGSVQTDVVFGPARVYTMAVRGPKWKS